LNAEKLIYSTTPYCAENGWSILYSTVTAEMQTYASERGYATMEFAGLWVLIKSR
jgi:hypothetical protein